MKTLLYAAAVLAVSAFSHRASAQAVQFARENITVSVFDSCCTLEGVYSFRNQGPAPARWSIYYPLLDSTTLPFPDSLAISDNSTRERLWFERAGDGVLFPLEVQAERTRRIRIWYRQRTPVRKFEYILTTTKAWGRPLERAEFHIVIPDSLQLISCSPAFDTREKKGQRTIYHIRKLTFMPDSNLLIHWKRRTS